MKVEVTTRFQPKTRIILPHWQARLFKNPFPDGEIPYAWGDSEEEAIQKVIKLYKQRMGIL